MSSLEKRQSFLNSMNKIYIFKLVVIFVFMCVAILQVLENEWLRYFIINKKGIENYFYYTLSSFFSVIVLISILKYLVEKLIISANISVGIYLVTIPALYFFNLKQINFDVTYALLFLLLFSLRFIYQMRLIQLNQKMENIDFYFNITPVSFMRLPNPIPVPAHPSFYFKDKLKINSKYFWIFLGLVGLFILKNQILIPIFRSNDLFSITYLRSYAYNREFINERALLDYIIKNYSILERWIFVFGNFAAFLFDSSLYFGLIVSFWRFFGVHIPYNFNNPQQSKSFHDFCNRINYYYCQVFIDLIFTQFFKIIKFKTSVSQALSVFLGVFIFGPILHVAIFFSVYIAGIWKNFIEYSLFYFFLMGITNAVSILIEKNNLVSSKKRIAFYCILYAMVVFFIRLSNWKVPIVDYSGRFKYFLSLVGL